MTKNEVAQMIAVLQANYPDRMRNQSEEALERLVKTWYGIFASYDKKAVYAAAMAFMANDTKGFMPVAGQINAYLTRLTQPEQITESEAWVLVNKAMQNSTYNSVEEFEKLPPNVRRLVGSATQLREWALIDNSETKSVVASNFQRSYREIANREEERKRLPDHVYAELKSYQPALLGGGME